MSLEATLTMLDKEKIQYETILEVGEHHPIAAVNAYHQIRTTMESFYTGKHDLTFENAHGKAVTKSLMKLKECAQ